MELPWPALLLAILGFAALGFSKLRLPTARPDTHGRSRWATPRDLESLSRRAVGPPLGWLGKRLLRLPPVDNLLVFGVQRSGKTSSVVVPALMEWSGPAIATSTKDELVKLTSRARALHGRILVFAPLDTPRDWGNFGGDAVAWNPLSEATTTGRAAELADVFTAEGKASPSAHWYLSAANLLTGLFLLEEQRGGDLRSVIRVLNDTPLPAFLSLGLQGGPVTAEILGSLARTPEKEAGSIVSTARAALSLWLDERVAQATAAGGHQLDIDELLAGSATLYLVAPAEDAERCRPLFSALLAAVLRRTTERARAQGGVLQPRLLLALDEIANFARVPRLPGYVSTGPGQGIQFLLAFHDLAQLEACYGSQEARTVWNNCRARLLLPGQGDLRTLRLFSDAIGQETVVYQTSSSGPRGEGHNQVRMGRPLVAIEDLRRSDQSVLLYSNLPPALLASRRWDQVPSWRELAPAAPTSTV